jgi:crotonobetainyl-CoA:carnitine CoA-transferase CaiB-like acyl-CoA transferase
MIRSSAPTLGQHNDEVYQHLLELAPPRYAELRRNGVI